LLRTYNRELLRRNGLEQLFTPISIGPLRLQNRICFAAMGPKLANIHGEVTDGQVAYYSARARGGPGMVVVEAAIVTEERNVGNLAIHNDWLIPGLSKLAGCVREWGVRAALQLSHFGGSRIGLNRQALPGSAAPDRVEPEEIDGLVDQFVKAAGRAKTAGFEAVQVHAAHGHLIFQFLSPRTNHRDDQFGGDPIRRAELLLRVIRGIKAELGPGYPVLCKISAEEFVENGFTIDDCLTILPLLEEAGLNALEVSAGNQWETKFWNVQPMSLPRACLTGLSKRLKAIATIPIVAVGRINDPILANDVIRDGKADMVAMGRALLADPDLPNKAAEGRLEDICRCIACNWCHGKRTWAYKPIACAVNPYAARERELELRPAVAQKHVLVVGGGVGGLEASMVLRQRGHRVTLVEKGSELGGQSSPLAVAPPHKDEVQGVVDYLIAQVRKLRVEVILGQTVTAKFVSDMHPDAVVIATGVRERVPALPGFDSERVTTAHRVLLGEQPTGERIAVAGAGQTGSETAEMLAQQGRQVVLVGRRPQIASDLEPLTRRLLVQRLESLRVEMHPGTEVVGLEAHDLLIRNGDGRTERVPVDAVVVAMGVESERGLLEELETLGVPAYAVGDCVRPAEIADAIHDAFRIASVL
jgi:2,4-dienoyl-CoA reductase-like NADH-dependent reductase (Old Yellow Enzyme family)/thioredoxin reductase